MSEELRKLLHKRFIARPDVKAIQLASGAYVPHVVKQGDTEERIPWRGRDLDAHLAGSMTFGHYLLSTDGRCKLFAFDIDLEKEGWLPTIAPPADYSNAGVEEYFASFEPANLREAWLDRKHPGRAWIKRQLREMAEKLMRTIHSELLLPCAAAYSGSKGLHVYAFATPDFGYMSGHDAREGARIVIDMLDCLKPKRGENFFMHQNQDPTEGYPNLSIEVFPKQDSLDGKDLGNLMRLPLGKNQKNKKDPTFFLDLSAPLAELRPADPVWALTDGTTDPWRRPGE